MKAVLCKEWGPAENLVVEEVAGRDPGPGEVRIRVRAAGVNFPDVLIIQKKYQVQPALPFTVDFPAGLYILMASSATWSMAFVTLVRTPAVYAAHSDPAAFLRHIVQPPVRAAVAAGATLPPLSATFLCYS